MFLGALSQSIPDIDFVAAFWKDTTGNLLAHRGFTHSLLFGLIAIVFFSLLAEHFHRKHRIGFKTWTLLFTLEIGAHLLLDLCNNYGMGLFEPFSHTRISFNTIYVADPFFSVVPAIAFTALLILKRGDYKRKRWWVTGVVAPLFYIIYCVFNKLTIDTHTRYALRQNNVPFTHYLTTPTPLNNWLWYTVAGDEKGYYVGYQSVFDLEGKINLTFFPRNDSLLQPVKDHEEVQKLLRFSQGFYTVEKWHDTLVFNDLRFGQIVGWHNPHEAFVFHYFLQHPGESNRLVVQRGRFAKWDKESIRSLYRKILGK